MSVTKFKTGSIGEVGDKIKENAFFDISVHRCNNHRKGENIFSYFPWSGNSPLSGANSKFHLRQHPRLNCLLEQFPSIPNENSFEDIFPETSLLLSPGWLAEPTCLRRECGQCGYSSQQERKESSGCPGMTDWSASHLPIPPRRRLLLVLLPKSIPNGIVSFEGVPVPFSQERY